MSQGTIPTEIGLLTNLSLLWMEQNSLVGALPTEVRLENATVTMITKATTTRTATTSPCYRYDHRRLQLGNLSLRNYLSLFCNQLTAQVPSELGRLKKLKIGLMLFQNSLSGSVPSEVRLRSP